MRIEQRVPQIEGAKGSQKWIQHLIEKCPNLLLTQIKQHGSLKGIKNIIWLSPKRNDDFAEYRDAGFLELLGLKEESKKLASFWPKKGPQWDALGINIDNPHRFFLVEAKANIPEIITECEAKNSKSIEQINASIHRTQKFLGIDSMIPWTKGFYQYANRVAHLYFMREIAKVDAYLVQIYFLGDKTHIPTSKEQWLGMLEIQKRLMGLSRHKLERFVIESFIDVQDIEDNTPTREQYDLRGKIKFKRGVLEAESEHAFRSINAICLQCYYYLGGGVCSHRLVEPEAPETFPRTPPKEVLKRHKCAFYEKRWNNAAI